MKDRLEALQVFVRVARTGSFSKAARELALAQSSVSRMISALEQDVGASLLSRTTRTVVLTEAGADYLARIEPVLLALDEADQFARGTGELRGVLRVGLPFSFALREIIPTLPEFLNANPGLRMELVLDDQRKDFLREGIDVALRVGALVDSTATARLIGRNPRVLVAAPEYLARAGTPRHPDELRGHSIVAGPAGNVPDAWSFSRADEHVQVRVDARIVVNANEGAVSATVGGLGVLSTGLLGCSRELASKSLVRVLADWTMSSADVHAVLPTGRGAKPSARAFVDFLAKSFARHHVGTAARREPTKRARAR